MQKTTKVDGELKKRLDEYASFIIEEDKKGEEIKYPTTDSSVPYEDIIKFLDEAKGEYPIVVFDVEGKCLQATLDERHKWFEKWFGSE